LTSSLPREAWSRGLKLQLGLAACVLLLFAWLSSGTLAPLAATTENPTATEPCRYLHNVDHEHHLSTFLMLDGAPHQQWERSVALRRMLFPLLAYPWMKVLGFDLGGFLTSLLIHLTTLVVLAAFLRRRVGEKGALLAIWLFATSPGIYYWIGLPYSYAIIVPCSVAATMLLWRIQDVESPGRAALLALAVGFLFLGYDLLPYFAPAALYLVWRKFRRLRHLATTAAMLLTPTVLNLAILKYGLRSTLQNPNTEIYPAILGAWMHRPDFSQWMGILLDSPVLLVHHFLASNCYFLPLLFVVFAWRSVRGHGASLVPFEKAIFGSALLVWAIMNLAPPYDYKWQIRGAWIARLYQPIFGVLLTFVARWWQALREKPWALRSARIAVVATVALNCAVMLGPWLSPSFEAQIYIHFYQHASPNHLVENFDKFGRRPLGFCKPPSQPGSQRSPSTSANPR
jgi:hypothetical protein